MGRGNMQLKKSHKDAHGGGGGGSLKEGFKGCKAFSQKQGTLVINVNKTIDKKTPQELSSPRPPAGNFQLLKILLFSVPRFATFIFHLIFNCYSQHGLQPSSIRCQDLNPQSLSCESSPLTTRPQLLAYIQLLCISG